MGLSAAADPYSKPLWSQYLQRVHGAISTLNALYGTNYATFDDVPVPVANPDAAVPDTSAPVQTLCAYYDWMNFNDEHFAAWHAWMNGLVLQAAPNAHTDIKILGGELFGRGGTGDGVDPEQFCAITDLGGNDDYTTMPDSDRNSGYAYGWQNEEMGYDLLRSFRRQPIVNSENHVIPDRYVNPVPGAYVRAAMWQGALHGQAATVIWVWSEASDPKSDLYGSIYFRPADIFGAGRAWLDAQRLSHQVAAVIGDQPHVALLYSRTSLYWQPRYAACLRSAYTALDFLGEPVTFVTEQELAAGKIPGVKAIVLPEATHVSDSAADALTRFAQHGGKLIEIGPGNLGYDQYARPRATSTTPNAVPLAWPADDRTLAQQFQPILQSLGVYTPLTDTATGQQAFGIEYRAVSVAGKRYVSAINLLKTQQTIAIPATGSTQIKDLLSGDNLTANHIEMPPMQPRLLLWP